jgi:hypothetical protein
MMQMTHMEMKDQLYYNNISPDIGPAGHRCNNKYISGFVST